MPDTFGFPPEPGPGDPFLDMFESLLPFVAAIRRDWTKIGERYLHISNPDEFHATMKATHDLVEWARSHGSQYVAGAGLNKPPEPQVADA